MTNIPLNIKRKMMAIIVGILLVFGAIIVFYQYNLVKKEFDNTIETLDETIHDAFIISLEQLKVNLALKSNFITRLPKLQTAFNNRDREALLNVAGPFYQRMTAQNPYVKIMTFRLADGSAFLRVHKPEMFGDQLNKKRKIIIDTNRLQEQQYGFEVGKLEMTYRVVTPVFYENSYIGSVEIGVKPEYFTDRLTALFKTKGAFLVKKEALLSVSDIMEGNVISGFVLVSGDDVFRTRLKDIKLDQDRVITDSEHSYIINDDLELSNHKGEATAKILLAYNIDDYLQKVNKMIGDIILHMSLLMAVLLLVLNYFINYFIGKMNILNKELALKSTELETFNCTLVDNIQKEVEKNRLKDQQLIQQSRLAQMGEMISMIAHQWRQPLAAIGATSASLEIKAKLHKLESADVEKKAHDIAKFTQYLSATIDDFRDFFKPSKEKRDTTYDEAISAVMAIIETSVTNKNIQLQQELNCHDMFSSYPNELKQVILNFIKNAEEVLLEKAVEAPYIKIATYTQEGQYILEVSDNGGGIEEEILAKIFDPYFSTKEKKDGTGLGLYMSKMIIEEHCGGTLSVVNSDEGAVFKIALTHNVRGKGEGSSDE